MDNVGFRESFRPVERLAGKVISKITSDNSSKNNANIYSTVIMATPLQEFTQFIR